MYSLYRPLGVLAFALAIVAAGLVAAGCGSGSSLAQYRAMQTIPDAPVNLDVSVDGASAFTNVGFEGVEPGSGYQSVAAGSDALEVFQTGTTKPVINSKTLNLITGSSTVVLTGLYATPTGRGFSGHERDTAIGAGVMRMIDVSPSAPASLDVYMVAPGTDIAQVVQVVSPLLFGQASLYVPIPTQSSRGLANVMVMVTATGSKTQILNQIYTPMVGQIRTLGIG
jgi:Domain of unknown function (DUF4397)